MEILKASTRKDNSGKSARRARRSGSIPGILYGYKKSNCLFEIGELELNKELFQKGEHSILNIAIDGENHKALIKEVQRDPVNHKIIHIDLEELTHNKPIIAQIPINYIGEENLTAQGAVIQREKNNVRVSCSPENLPKYINFNLKNAVVGNVFTIADLEVAEEISIVEDFEAVIASISLEQKVE